MNNYIFISKIFSKSTDYDMVKTNFSSVFGNGTEIDEYDSNHFQAIYFPYNILLINGSYFNDARFNKWAKDITIDSYKSLIENIENVYEKITKDEKFEEVFKPNETIICIHWGGSSNKNEAMNKVLEGLRKDKKSEELFSITYFTNGDGAYYGYLTNNKEINEKKIKENIETAFEFYKMRANNLLVKKKIYELMESIFIYGFDFYLKQTSKQFSIEKTKDSLFFNTTSEDIKLLETEKKCLYHQNTKNAIDSFFSLLKKEGDEKIYIPNIQTFRSDTYDLLNKIEGPIYPKAL